MKPRRIEIGQRAAAPAPQGDTSLIEAHANAA
jgi:hypothetical protein